MRWLVIGGAFTVLGFVSAANAQNAGIPPLERVIDTSYRISIPAHECTVPSAVLRLVRRYHFMAGIEYLPADCHRRFAETPKDGAVIDLHHLSIAAALNKLTDIDPRYRWMELDGIVVVRPVDAWTDPKDLLNFTTAAFVLEDVNVGGALEAVIAALTGESQTALALDQSAQRTEQGARRFNVKTGATSLADVLNAIVRAHGDAWWQFGEAPAQPDLTPVASIHTFDGTGLGISTRKRSPAR